MDPTDKNCGNERCEKKHFLRKSSTNYTWSSSPGAIVPYAEHSKMSSVLAVDIYKEKCISCLFKTYFYFVLTPVTVFFPPSF